MSKITLTFAGPVAPEFRWFAWYPVKTSDRGTRWLSFVYKRRYATHSYLNGPWGTFFMYTVEKGLLA